MSPDDSLTWSGRAEEIAEVWRLERHGEFRRATLWTHPLGAELRLFGRFDGGGEQLLMTHAFKTLGELIAAAGVKRVYYETQGWRVVADWRQVPDRKASGQ